VWFAFGVASAAVGMGVAYFANRSNAGNAQNLLRTWGHPFLVDTPASKRLALYATVCTVLGVIFWLVSILCLVMGMLAVKDVFAHL
jgi:ABC-type uncharacterized transport system permease subunit